MNVTPYPQTRLIEDCRSANGESGSDNGWQPGLREQISCSTIYFGRTN